MVFFQGLRDLGYVDGLRTLATPEPINDWTLTCSPHRKRSMTRDKLVDDRDSSIIATSKQQARKDDAGLFVTWAQL